MPRSMTEVHLLGHHKNYPPKRCPLCKEPREECGDCCPPCDCGPGCSHEHCGDCPCLCHVSTLGVPR